MARRFGIPPTTAREHLSKRQTLGLSHLHRRRRHAEREVATDGTVTRNADAFTA